MNTLIVANGTLGTKSFYRPLLKNMQYVIAADGGADNCLKLGITPDKIIGDMDSISHKAKKNLHPS